MRPESYESDDEDRDEEDLALLEAPPKDVETPRRGKVVMTPNRQPSDIDEVTRTAMSTCLNDDDTIQRWRVTRMPEDRKVRTVLVVAFTAFEAGDCVTMRAILRTQLREGTGT